MANQIGHLERPKLLSTGIHGLDEILRGGLAARRLYLIEGDPGSGKTTLGLQYLIEGVRQGERCMLVTLSETKEELSASAASHGWSLEGVEVMEVVASEESLNPQARNTMYHPSEVEMGETTKAVLGRTDQFKPSRLVIDSLSEFRLLAGNPLRYRRQILALKQHFARQGCTVFFVDDRTDSAHDKHLHSLAHGVIRLDRQTAEFGTVRRRLEVCKLRGQQFHEGSHDFVIRRGGISVFPQLVAADHGRSSSRDVVMSGLAALDSLLGGGVTAGTSTLILGAAGTGKSSLATRYVESAVNRGEHAVVLLFDESIGTFLERSAGLGYDVQHHLENGSISLIQVDPAQLSPGELAHLLRQIVETKQSRLVVIDSLNGYLNAMPNERFLTLHLHELLSYLGNQHVTSILVMTQHGFIGGTEVPLDVSYVADAVILLRYFEAFGEVRQAISVVKKRTGKHERTIRELRIDHGIEIGEPLREFRGVLTGLPEFVGKGLSSAGRTDETRSNDA